MLLSWILALAAPQAASAMLEPSTPWTTTTKDIGCVAGRNYGLQKQVTLGWDAQVSASGPTLMLAGPKKSLPDGIGEVRVTLDTGAALAIRYGAFPLADRGQRLIKLFPSEADKQQLAGAKTAAIGTDGLQLDITGLYSDGIAALNTCMTKLISGWGADPQPYLQRQIGRPTGMPQRWFANDNYPREAMAHHISGDVVLLLETSAQGRVSKCTVLRSTDKLLDKGTCAAATNRVQVRPPVDAAGQPMASYLALRVHWNAP